MARLAIHDQLPRSRRRPRHRRALSTTLNAEPVGERHCGTASEAEASRGRSRFPHPLIPSSPEGTMKIRRALLIAGFVALAVAALPHARPDVTVGPTDIGGVVTGPRGPEAGVWVIAETNDLPTRFVRIVVTDDQGRYLIPDLPKARYSVWVRGYGLVDSPKSASTPGATLALTAVPAPDARAAAAYYPAGYWFSLLKVPDKKEFPGTGPEGNGISPNVKSQADFIRTIKSGTCMACHQLGSRGTREIPDAFRSMPTSFAQWERRTQSGQAGAQMTARDRHARPSGSARDVRRLDRSHRRGRAATGAAPPAGDRAQRRHHRVGLGRSESVSARRRLHRSAQPTRQRERPALRIARAERGLPPGARSGAQHDQPRAAHRARHETRIAAGPPTGAPSAYWGDTRAVDEQGRTSTTR